MALQYCEICEKQIDLDVDVEHFMNHEEEVTVTFVPNRRK